MNSSDEEMAEVEHERAVETFAMDVANPYEAGGGQFDEDDQMEMDEVEAKAAPKPTGKPLEIVIHAPEPTKVIAPKRRLVSAEERASRLLLHKVHTICLLAAVKHRNELINDDVLKARLMSKIPLFVQNAFTSISPTTTPEETDRSRLFEQALAGLVSFWWRGFIVQSSLGYERTRTFHEVAMELRAKGVGSLADLIANDDDDAGMSEKKKGKRRAQEDLPFAPHEIIRSAQSLMKRAVSFKGSRDMSAQLFTATCRALGIPARLICSLQPISWRATANNTEGEQVAQEDDDDDAGSSGKKRKRAPSKPKAPKKRRKKAAPVKGSDQATDAEADSDEAIEFEEVHTPKTSTKPKASGSVSTPIALSSDAGDSDFSRATGSVDRSARKPKVKLRATRPVKMKREASTSPEPDDMQVIPTFWTEVFDRSAKKWICVDVTRKKIRYQQHMEPARANRENQLTYVVAFEDDGYARDVTLRYAKTFATRTIKERPTRRKADEPDWWQTTFSQLERPYRLERNETEDAELNRATIDASMPTTLAGFKNHPYYVLADDLKREEALRPRAQKIGIFRSTQVYPRSAVIVCKAPEAWMREGRRIKAGEVALKWVKRRAVTINRKREQEMAQMDGEEAPQQGLYAEYQTELDVPAPIVDGQIPRNSFNNIDIFAPHMVPAGATHLPYKGIAKIVKKLGVSYAEANTGFEFKKQRAIPVITGIVVAEDMVDTVLEAFEAHEKVAAERAAARLEEKCLKRWKKLIEGLNIRERLDKDYKQAEPSKPTKAKPAKAPARAIADDEEDMGVGSSTAKVITINNALPRSAKELEKAAEAALNKRGHRTGHGRAETMLSDDEGGADEGRGFQEAESSDGFEEQAFPPPRATRSKPAGQSGRSLRQRKASAAQKIQEALGEASSGDELAPADVYELSD